MRSLVAVASVAGLALGCRSEATSVLPPVGQLPAFSLIDQDGQRFDSAALAGRVWIADFVFTSCPTRCAELTEKMRALRETMRDLAPPPRFISFSVDPENDDPAALRAFRTKHQASWPFLTGSVAAITQVVVDGFRQPIDRGRPVSETERMQITHGTRLVLVGPKGRIRGLYETDPRSLKALVDDVRLLNHRERPRAMATKGTGAGQTPERRSL